LPAPAFSVCRGRRGRLRDARFARLTGFTTGMVPTAAAAPILNGEQCTVEWVGRYHCRLHPQHATQRQQSHPGFHCAFHRKHRPSVKVTISSLHLEIHRESISHACKNAV
jgi:hypothetical protein